MRSNPLHPSSRRPPFADAVRSLTTPRPAVVGVPRTTNETRARRRMIGGLREAQSYRGALLERERMTTSCVALVAPVTGVHVGTCMHSPREDTMPGTPLVQMVFARRFIATGLAVAVAGIAACEPNDRAAAPPQSDQPAALDTAAVRAAIDSLRTDYEQAVASGNFDKMATALAEGAVMVPPGGPKSDAMFASSKLPFPPGATIDITPLEVRVLSPD